MEMANENHVYLVALKTLEERCRYLQQKLEAVEEENSRLKMKVPPDLAEQSPRSTSEVAQLQEQVALLTKQKSLLSHQIQMVATENHSLWSRLSKLTTTNQNLGNRLSIIGDSEKCLDPNATPTNSNINLIHGNLQSSEYCKESLEEISLKIINGILLEKTELENQYAQMVDLQNDNEQVDIQNFCFSLPEEDNGPLLLGISKHIQKLNQFKQVLMQQKNNLTAAISHFKTFNKNYVCTKCVNNRVSETVKINNMNFNNNPAIFDGVVEGEEQSLKDLTPLQVHDSQYIGEVTTPVPDKICPLCGIVYTGSFEEFHEHVSNHLSEDEMM